MTKQDYYFLNPDHTVKPCSCMKWAQQIEVLSNNHMRHVEDEIVNGKRISTVFLGLNHNHWGNEPHIFETMVFDENRNDIYMMRYSSWEEAELGHKAAKQWVLDGCKDDEEQQ